MQKSPPRLGRFSRRGVFRALVAASPVLAAPPLKAQVNDTELAAAERRLAAAAQILNEFPLPADAEPAAIFKA